MLTIRSFHIKKQKYKVAFCNGWLVSVSVYKKIIFITSGSKKRVRSITEIKDLDCLCRVYKPLPFCFWRALRGCKLKAEDAIIIGDQVFDDILGGNLVGIFTILVKPLEMEKAYRIRIKRYFESKILCKMEAYRK